MTFECANTVLSSVDLEKYLNNSEWWEKLRYHVPTISPLRIHYTNTNIPKDPSNVFVSIILGWPLRVSVCENFDLEFPIIRRHAPLSLQVSFSKYQWQYEYEVWYSISCTMHAKYHLWYARLAVECSELALLFRALFANCSPQIRPRVLHSHVFQSARLLIRLSIQDIPSKKYEFGANIEMNLLGTFPNLEILHWLSSVRKKHVN